MCAEKHRIHQIEDLIVKGVGSKEAVSTGIELPAR